MNCFACKDEKNIVCFVSWMSVLFWCTSDSLENKVASLVSTWSLVNNTELTEEADVTKMLTAFWTYWTKASFCLGSVENQCETNLKEETDKVTTA